MGILSQERTLQSYFESNISALEKRCTATQADAGIFKSSTEDENSSAIREKASENRSLQRLASAKHPGAVTPSELPSTCPTAHPLVDPGDTHKLSEKDNTKPDLFTTLWVGGFQSKRKGTEMLRTELSKLLDADASRAKRLTHGSFKFQVLTRDVPRILRLNGTAHQEFPSGIKIERYTPLHSKQTKLTRDPAEHGKELAPKSGNQSGSCSNRKGSDGGKSNGKGRDGITTATRAPTVSETLDTMQVDESSASAAKTNGETGRTSNTLSRSELVFKVGKSSRRDKSGSNKSCSSDSRSNASTISGRRGAYIGSNSGERGLGRASGGDRDSSNESGPVSQDNNRKAQVERCKGCVKGISDANRPSSNGRGGSHDRRRGKHVQQPATALEAIPEAMEEETSTQEAPAPAVTTASENKTDTSPALAPATPFANTKSGSTPKPMSLKTLPHNSHRRENLLFHPYKRAECLQEGAKRTSLVGPAGSGSTTPFSQSVGGEASAIAPPIQAAIEPDRDFISQFYDEDASGMRTLGAKFWLASDRSKNKTVVSVPGEGNCFWEALQRAGIPVS
jgi:hypothetical protein